MSRCWSEGSFQDAQSQQTRKRAKYESLFVIHKLHSYHDWSYSFQSRVFDTLLNSLFVLFPVMNTKRSDDSSASKDCVIDLDHNKFKCKVPGCSKAFRKAKLLDYHLKYYHNTEKDMDSEACSPDRVGRTRATSASMPTSTLSDISDNKRRRTVSTSSCRFPEVHLCVLLVLMSEYEYYIILSFIFFFFCLSSVLSRFYASDGQHCLCEAPCEVLQEETFLCLYEFRQYRGLSTTSNLWQPSRQDSEEGKAFGCRWANSTDWKDYGQTDGLVGGWNFILFFIYSLKFYYLSRAVYKDRTKIQTGW